ncbi:MAG: VWA domain-containing protein [Treponema sp.]|jgi:hypothetical protein|nr:VWA domain-containing protein [Treponema sp.]
MEGLDSRVSQAAAQLGRLYGLWGLEIRIEHADPGAGAGTSCSISEKGIIISFDPESFVETPGIPPLIAALYVIARELGRASEAVKNPEYFRAYRKKSKIEKTFYDFLDYTAIDYAGRRIPLLDRYMDDIYTASMPHDLTDLALHMELLYAIRISQVEKNPKKKLMVDPRVADILAGLRNYRAGGFSFDVIESFSDPHSSMAERRQIADIFIKPRYHALLRENHRERTGADRDNEADGKGEKSAADMFRDQFMDALAGEEKKSPPLRGGESRPEGEGVRSVGGSNETYPLTAMAEFYAEALRLDTADARRYAASLVRWRPVIRRIAELFLALASPSEVLLSPRYDHSARPEGFRLHPLRINQAAIQQASGTPHAIWQPLKRSGRRQDLSFGGLDVYLLTDISASMEGEKARCAADTALCLIEGLQMASYMARNKNRLKRPDVRIELTAFGAAFDVVCPLSYEPAGEQKGKLFLSLRNANSKGTYISGALDSIRQSAQKNDCRKKLVFIVSDGRFHDPDEAGQAARSLGPDIHIKQIFIRAEGFNTHVRLLRF